MLALSGLFAPLVTPFTDDGASVSEIRLARLVHHLVGQGVDGFVACTETGEFTTVSASERKTLLELLIREAKGAPVLAHCTRLGTAQALDLCQHASRHGARAAIVMPPYYGTFSDAEIEQHIRRIVQHAGLPVILVDPQHLIRSSMKDGLSGLTGIYFAESLEDSFHRRLAVDPTGSGPDEFAIEDAVVSPLIQICGSRSKDPDHDLRPIARMIATYGRTRVAKAALSMAEVEVGPPRPPVLSLQQEALPLLAQALQIV